MVVSTHSRPKAAGQSLKRLNNEAVCFNTQPPEGGWRLATQRLVGQAGFNTQPPEGGWARGQFPGFQICCFNTQPPEGGWFSLLPELHL